MWPWEHLAFGYVWLSGVMRVQGRTPSDWQALALAFGTQAPDLVDKPLGWEFDVIATGIGPAHSVLVAGPVLAVLVGVGWYRGTVGIPGAFTLGYASHLLGDVVNALREGGSLSVGKVLWPVVRYPPYEQKLGLVDRFTRYLSRFLSRVGEGDVLLFVGAYLLVFVLVGLLWLADGAPVARALVLGVRRRIDL